jgi:hypothetical protein
MKKLVLLCLLFLPSKLLAGEDKVAPEARIAKLEEQVNHLWEENDRLGAYVKLFEEKADIEAACRKYLIRHGLKNPKLGIRNSVNPDYDAGVSFHYYKKSWTAGCRIFNKKFNKIPNTYWLEMSLDELERANEEGEFGECKK